MIVLVAAYFSFKKDLAPLKQGLVNFIATDSSIGSIKHDTESVKEQVFTPGPLKKVTSKEITGTLTVSGVINETNKQRLAGGLKTLKESSLLQKAAAGKIDDMFSKQYFEHISPTGSGPSDLAKKVGYDFIIIGENLALGNFKDDADLVNAWMASPGHRENIMRQTYQEIGVAVKQGTFKGEKVWLAVQEFGTPSAACPATDQVLLKQLDTDKIELAKQETIINQKKIDLEAYQPKDNQIYANLVREYNNLIQQYNDLVLQAKIRIEDYNSQADAYNTCLKTFNP